MIKPDASQICYLLAKEATDLGLHLTSVRAGVELGSCVCVCVCVCGYVRATYL